MNEIKIKIRGSIHLSIQEKGFTFIIGKSDTLGFFFRIKSEVVFSVLLNCHHLSNHPKVYLQKRLWCSMVTTRCE